VGCAFCAGALADTDCGAARADPIAAGAHKKRADVIPADRAVRDILIIVSSVERFEIVRTINL
jgi:hypothetical protein